MPKKKKPQSWLKKAYRNEEFMTSPAARNIRVLCEMTEPAHVLRKHNVHNTVVFFGSARILPLAESQKKIADLKKSASNTAKSKQDIIDAEHALKLSGYYEDARQLAKKLTLWFNETQHANQHFYVCSGGGPGIMEAANRGAKEAGGKSVGLNINLFTEQDPNPYQTQDISFEFHYFFIRKFWFFYLAKALVVFPGGYGTLDELFELLTLIQTQKTKKHMPVILYGSHFWKELLDFNAMQRWGVISKDDLGLFKIIDNVDEAFTYLQAELKKNYFKSTRPPYPKP